jgi:hypothetical protein
MNKYLTRLIKHILINDTAARDNWMDTIRQVHDREMQLWYFTKEQYYEAFFAGNLSNVHTIKRLWQLVQEKHPELRGETWEERQRQGGMVAAEMAEDRYFQLDLFGNDTRI